jgi:flavin reductase (DIM6/NTAB) family NADH-FMN oxidoreductase RutF
VTEPAPPAERAESSVFTDPSESASFVAACFSSLEHCVWERNVSISMKQSLGAKPLVFPAPVFVVGTYDDTGRPNIATIAWGGLCCSDPPCVAISLREATYTYENLVKREAFTVNIPGEAQMRVADFCGLVSGRLVDKFVRAGLTAVRGEHVDAPAVVEFPMVLECKLVRTVPLGLHTQFIGQILDVRVESALLGPGDIVDLEKLRPLVFAPDSTAYHGMGPKIGQGFSEGKEV